MRLWRYEIDLHSKKAAALRKSLSEFVAGARHVRNTSPFAEPTLRRQVKKRTPEKPAGDCRFNGGSGSGLTER